VTGGSQRVWGPKKKSFVHPTRKHARAGRGKDAAWQTEGERRDRGVTRTGKSKPVATPSPSVTVKTFLEEGGKKSSLS